MLNQNIKAYRKFKGWTQEQMATELGLTRDNIASYERGLAKPPLEVACKICDDLSISLHDLMYGEILNPTIGLHEKSNSRVLELEEELANAYRTIGKLTQEKIKQEGSDNIKTIAAEDPTGKE